MGVPSRHGDPREDHGEALPQPRQEPTPARRRPAPATLPVPSQPQWGSPEAGRMKNRHSKTNKDANEEFRTGYDATNMEGEGVTVKEIGQYLGLAERTVRDRIKKLNGEFTLKDGKILKTDEKDTGSNQKK